MTEGRTRLSWSEVGDPKGPVVVYFHGGGHVIGSIALMDNVARNLAHHSGSTVVSVEYRLAPEYPFPAATHDCYAVTEWVKDHGSSFGADPSIRGAAPAQDERGFS